MISLVIPAYKAQSFIYKNLLELKSVMDEVGKSYEIICVVDGNVDDTLKQAQKAQKRHPKLIKVDGYLTNLGKGHAVRFGMAKSKGDIIGFIDAGMDINPNGIKMLLEHMRWYDADIVIGSKRHPVSKVNYPWQRKFISFCYQMLVRALFGLKVKDTQVGIKFYKRKVLEEVLPRVLVKQFAFDVEILAVANYLGYTKIYEAPIELDMEFGNKLTTFASKGFLRMSILMAWNTLAVFYRLKIKKFYDTKNKKDWVTPKYLTLK